MHNCSTLLQLLLALVNRVFFTILQEFCFLAVALPTMYMYTLTRFSNFSDGFTFAVSCCLSANY